MKTSIIIPTYNESENIKILIPKIHDVLNDRSYEILIVDDNSPDGTADVAREFCKNYPVKIFVRRKKLGLASAILYGFERAKGEILGVIDADLQHPPKYMRDFIKKIEDGYDIVIGSRYVKGGKIEGWGLKRRIISRGAILLAEPLVLKVKDPMSGYFFLKRHVIEDVDFTLTGYKILLEILVKGRYDKVAEVPYIFRDRRLGESKLNGEEILGYIKLISHLYKYKSKKLFLP